ncbi:hypothetical protein Mal4_20020 [Maioricimonas rarisocia]|uniref:Bacterial Ig-like domain (Group 2) n=1 Tax=Maioricimonas rarisocia TaxID=2528026 RepID=A0A517Z5C8_9PLAN|nr:DUF1549 and DUF1553 domain-containing protein [Maioricimonas rarisocia]QDU37686.1 hypothetical protein Mal4_20020 [Maioricimonas rarisocia]
MRLPAITFAILLVACTTIASADENPVSFRFDVLPALTRAGCNAGTCHGTPTGKNGFHLSLRGFDAAHDWTALTREVNGRRINRQRPQQSLILLKATAAVPHEGGRRLQKDGRLYRLIERWLREGATDDSDQEISLAAIEMTPRAGTINHDAEPPRLLVTAKFSDGSRRDVTHLARFSSTDEEIATIAEDGSLERHGPGEVTLAAEYAGQFASSTFILRRGDVEVTWDRPQAGNFIDDQVFAKLEQLQIEPSELSSDEEFLRRICLDLHGRLPTPDEIRSFVGDDTPDKRSRLIDTLIDSPQFADWWAMKWTDRLGCNQRFVGKWGAQKYHQWIRHAMATNVPEDAFFRQLLTGSGGNYSSPPASFWRRLRVGGIGDNIDPLMATEEISQLVLGVRIQCARCHNHPGERWTQDDFYGLAAFFARVKFKKGPYYNHNYDKEDTVFPIATGDVTHPRTGQIAPPRLLDGHLPVIADDEDRRVTFAEWATAPENPWFARAAVNRIWFHLFGQGIVDPVDDFRSSNPPTHPELLDSLADEFIRSGFDRKELIRLVTNSRVYQLSSKPTPTNADDDRYFSHRAVRLLHAEQLLDAVATVTGVEERFPGMPPGTRAVALPDGEYKHPFLEAFGRPARASACECERDSGLNFSQALHLVGGRVVQDKIHSESGRAAALAGSDRSADELAEELVLLTFSRFPTDEEQELLRTLLTSEDRRRAVEDVLWTLINHREFLFQH